jgi:hypothetical protein
MGNNFAISILVCVLCLPSTSSSDSGNMFLRSTTADDVLFHHEVIFNDVVTSAVECAGMCARQLDCLAFIMTLTRVQGHVKVVLQQH